MTNPASRQEKIRTILESVRTLAIQYYEETGKPLGVTGEIAEFEAARILGLELCGARQDGYDACRVDGSGPKRIQIKGRRIMEVSKPGQRLGAIQLKKEWDSVMLVLLDDEYRATAIYEADRPNIKSALEAPGSKARNERGALAVSKFKSIGRLVWQREPVVSKAKPAKAAAKKAASIRSAGLAFLEGKLSKPALQEALGFDAAALRRQAVKKNISVSKLYSPEKSWTGKPAWWNTLPVDKLRSRELEKLVFLCERADGDGFHILAVPKAWLRDHQKDLDITGGRLDLFLSARGADLFRDQRASGKLDFSPWVQG